MKRKMSLLSNCWSLNFQQQWPGLLVFAVFFLLFFFPSLQEEIGKGLLKFPFLVKRGEIFLI